MSALDIFGLLAAGLCAGTVNTVVGSGSLITFPVLLAIGIPPVVANMTNNVGLVPGGLSGVHAYRRELEGQRRRVLSLAVMSLAGGVLGAMLLIEFSGSVFRRIVPVLILIAVALVALQPLLSRWLAEHRSRHEHGGLPLFGSTFATGVYGGYFGAAQGVILFALLATFVDDDLQRLNAAKNCLVTLVNGTAAVLFIALGHLNWAAVGFVALGSVGGGQAGGYLGRRLSPTLLRIMIVIVGLAVGIALLVTG